MSAMAYSTSFQLFLFLTFICLCCSSVLPSSAGPVSPVNPESQKWTCHLAGGGGGDSGGSCNVASEDKPLAQELNLSLSTPPCVQHHHVHYASPSPSFSGSSSPSYQSTCSNLTLVGRIAPAIEAEIVTEENEFGTMRLADYRHKMNVLLLFYPADFTYVCPSELLAFNRALPDFLQRDVQVFGISVDSKFSHAAWRHQTLKDGGIGKIGFPLISDISKEISRNYGLLTPDGSVSLRGLFLIDRKGYVQHQLVNNLPLGRSVEEALRVVDAMQHTEEFGEVCPANWKKGKPAMTPTKEGVGQYLTEYNDMF
eukprot:GHVS01036815.1.p1 GENE.GHVS01036815.1~~GHVS01036815.1.p1  ORF type:complete len:311 (-),score=64.63 GHVS01036815.1:376-1308(-)